MLGCAWLCLWIDGHFGPLTVKCCQYHLKRRGFLAGPLDANFDAKTIQALQRFLGLTGNWVDGCFGMQTVGKLQAFLAQSKPVHAHLSILRVAHDGQAYSLEEFKHWYGNQWQQRWDASSNVPTMGTPPRGLSVAGVSKSLAQKALNELMPHFRALGNVIEVGMDIDMKQQRWQVRRAAAGELHDFPQMHALIKDAHRQFCLQGICLRRPLEEDRINVTCRWYSQGVRLKFHVDRKQWYEADVYGCVLANTSQEVLEFHRKHNREYLRYPTDEHPGVIYRQTGEARFDWSHGVARLRQGERVSVSWRWFKKECKVPGCPDTVRPEDSMSSIDETVIDGGGSIISGHSFETATSGLSMLSADGPRCLLAGTVLPCSPVHYKSVEAFSEGDIVVSSDATLLTITSIKVHAENPQPCVTLCSGDITNCFSESHRVSIQRAGKQQAVKASTLRPGDDVFISGGATQKLSTVTHFIQTCPVYELTLHPDLPIESYNMPHGSILTHGRGMRRSHRPPLPRGELNATIPDTESELGFSTYM